METVSKTIQAMIDRATAMPLSLANPPEEIESQALGDIDPDRFVEGDEGIEAMRQLRGVIRGHATGRMIDVLKRGRHRISIPPRPSSEDFLDFMGKRLGIGRGALKGWLDSIYSKPILAYIFAEILARGELTELAGWSPTHRRRRILPEHREAEIELKRQWFDDLLERGVMPDIMDKVLSRHFGANRTNDLSRAAAEYNRFSRYSLGHHIDRRRVPDLVVSDINNIHRLDPQLDGERFVNLLMPYEGRMDVEGWRKRVEWFAKYHSYKFKFARAATIFAWHTEPSDRLMKRLLRIIKARTSYTDYKKFAYAELAVHPLALLARIEMFARDGLDTKPLEQALDDAYPGSIPGTPAARKRAQGMALFPRPRLEQLEIPLERLTGIRQVERYFGAVEPQLALRGMPERAFNPTGQMVLLGFPLLPPPQIRVK